MDSLWFWLPGFPYSALHILDRRLWVKQSQAIDFQYTHTFQPSSPPPSPTPPPPARPCRQRQSNPLVPHWMVLAWPSRKLVFHSPSRNTEGVLVPLPRVVSMGLSRELISVPCPRETVGLWYPPPELNPHLCQAAQPQWTLRKWCWMTKPVPKGYHLCDSIYATELKWQNHTNGEQSSQKSGAGEETEGV